MKKILDLSKKIITKLAQEESNVFEPTRVGLSDKDREKPGIDKSTWFGNAGFSSEKEYEEAAKKEMVPPEHYAIIKELENSGITTTPDVIQLLIDGEEQGVWVLNKATGRYFEANGMPLNISKHDL